MTGFRAYLQGVSRTAACRGLVAVMVVVGLLGALVAAAPAAVAMSEPARRPAIRGVIDDVDAWMVIDALSTPPLQEASAAFAGEGSRRAVQLALLTMTVLLLLTWLSSAFLSGGALRTFAEGDCFRWSRFLRSSWRWFGTLLLWGLLQTVATVVLFVPLLVAAGVVVTVVGGCVTWVVVALLLALALLWLALMEFGRVVVVVGERRNVFRAFGQAVRFVLRRPLRVGVLYGLSVLSWVVVYVLYRWALVPRLPRTWWLLAFVLQQGFVALWLRIRLGRWAGGVALYQLSSA